MLIYLLVMAKYLKIPQKQIAIAVSDFTEEILNAPQAKILISDTSYQIIPGFIDSYSHSNLYEIIIALLPLSKYMHLDTAIALLIFAFPSR